MTIIGIDLGTTNCCMAVLHADRPRTIPLQDGAMTMPSAVAFTDDGIIVGAPARRQAAVNAKRTVWGAKRLMGRAYDDDKVKQWRKLVPYDIAAAENGDARIQVDDRLYGPEEISALLLKELKKNAEAFLDEEVTSAVITVPAYFNDRQRQATKDAAEIAGLSAEHIVNEPTAAALASGTSKGQDECLAVFDLGGGTFDITILQKTGDLYEVLSTHGDTFLGGEDVDQRLIAYLVKKFYQKYSLDLGGDPAAMQRLRESAELTKRALSAAPEAAIKLPFLAQSAGAPLHLNIKSFSRAKLEELAADVIDALSQPCYEALDGAGLLPEDIDRVLLAGGMTRMPAVQKVVHQIFEREPEHHINPDEIVALGAATQSGILTGALQGVTLLDVTPLSLGIKVNQADMRVVVPRNTPVPISEERSFTTTFDNQQQVRIEVFQGEDSRTYNNEYLGEFVLGGLPKRPGGELEIVVSFILDADGILHVTAVDNDSGQEAQVEIKPASGLTEREVAQIRNEHANDTV